MVGRNFEDTYHSIVYDFLFNQKSFEERCMSLAYVLMVFVLAHTRLARSANRHAEQSMRSGHFARLDCFGFDDRENETC